MSPRLCHASPIMREHKPRRSRVALLHRYGLEGWLCCGGHAVPRMIELLSKTSDVHFFGPRPTEPEQPELRNRVTYHPLPWTFDRSNPRDKWRKTLRFYFALPGIGHRCRKLKIDLVYWEETLPMGTTLLQWFYGPNICVMVMDFFLRIYTEKKPWLHWLRGLVERLDCRSWKKLPVIFTHVRYARDFLVQRGVPAERIHVVPNPCNHSVFHPLDAATRAAVRREFGFEEADIVMSHHGILHPNKGNDWLLDRLAELKDEGSRLKFLLIGDGAEMARLKEKAAELDIADRVVFAGWLLSERALNTALASADIGLVMRIGQETDHFHMTDTLSHEMACGKPILAVRLHGISEFIRDGENGLLFKPDNPGEFREKAVKLARDGGLRRTLGAAALQCSREVSDIDACARRMVEPLLSMTAR